MEREEENFWRRGRAARVRDDRGEEEEEEEERKRKTATPRPRFVQISEQNVMTSSAFLQVPEDGDVAACRGLSLLPSLVAALRMAWL